MIYKLYFLEFIFCFFIYFQKELFLSVQLDNVIDTVYRDIRKSAYAVLFSTHPDIVSQKSSNVNVTIKEICFDTKLSIHNVEIEVKPSNATEKFFWWSNKSQEERINTFLECMGIESNWELKKKWSKYFKAKVWWALPCLLLRYMLCMDNLVKLTEAEYDAFLLAFLYNVTFFF